MNDRLFALMWDDVQEHPIRFVATVLVIGYITLKVPQIVFLPGVVLAFLVYPLWALDGMNVWVAFLIGASPFLFMPTVFAIAWMMASRHWQHVPTVVVGVPMLAFVIMYLTSVRYGIPMYTGL